MKRLPLRWPWAMLPCLLFIGLGTCRADIDAQTQSVLHDRLMRRAKVAVEVLRLGDAPAAMHEVYTLEGATPLMPASNLKVVTTSAALDGLGGDFKFRTLLLRHGDDLVLIGDGDPTFGDAELLKKAGWTVTTVYESWAKQLQKLGIGSIHDVIVDDSVFDQAFFHPHWPANQADYHYMAEVAGMNLNANLIDLSVQPGAPGARVSYTLNPATHYVSIQNNCVTGTQNAIGVARDAGTNHLTLRGQTPSRGTAHVSCTIHDPPLYAATVLAETLSTNGVKMSGAVRRDRTLRAMRKDVGGWSVIGIHETPLSAVLGRANKDSINLYAESLCKRLGCATAHQSGTWENGIAAVDAFLKKVGVPAAEYHLDDGCGLSRQNVVSPRTLARVLAYDFYGRNRQTFFDSLSVAGVDGTLEDRFRGSDLRRRVFGKSGFIEGVSTLSGYLHGRDGQWYVFSIMMNGIPPKSNGEIKLLQEKIVKAIDAEVAVAAGQ